MTTEPTVKQIQAAITGARERVQLDQIRDDIQAALAANRIDQVTAHSLAKFVDDRQPELPERVDVAALPLSEFATSGLFREVRSGVLGETVIFAADNAKLPADTPLVVYRTAELRELVGASPERLRAVHATKRALDGELIGDLLERSSDEQVIPSEALYTRSAAKDAE